MVVVEQALAVEEDTLEHSLAMCLVLLQAEVLLEMALSLCLTELAIFTKLGGKVRVGLFLVSVATASVSVTRVTGVALSATVIFIFVSILSSVGFFIALLFIVRAFVLVGGWIFSGHLRTVLPISGLIDWVREWSLWRVLGLPMRVILSLMQDRRPQYICWWRAVSPHWAWVARWFKLTRYFTMHWLSHI